MLFRWRRPPSAASEIVETRRWLTCALVFVLGVASGTAGAGWGWSLPWTRAAAPSPARSTGQSDAAPVVTKVRGRELGAASGSSVFASVASTPRAESLAPRRQPREAESKAPVSEPFTPSPSRARDVASEGLRVATYVTGGHVYASGILLDEAGHVLTCDHVIEGLEKVEVAFAEGPSRPAEVIARDGTLDLALLKVEDVAGTPARLSSIDTVEAGDELFAMGAPGDMPFTLSRGMATYVGREVDGVRFLQTDLPLNGGSSGGPVMNARGEVVAVASFVLRDTEGLAFALPIDYAYRRFSAWLTPPEALASARGAFERWEAGRPGAAPTP